MRLDNFLNKITNTYKYSLAAICCIILFSSGKSTAEEKNTEIQNKDYSKEDIAIAKKELDSLRSIDHVLSKEIEIKQYKKQIYEQK